MRLDSEHGIKITGWRKRQQSFDINYNDPVSFRPLAMGKHAPLLWSHATMQGWMTKHMPPAFSFTKTRHRRYVLLLDRFIYTFKNDNPKHDFREFFELTANTNIFVTDQFPGVLYCIEIQRKEDGRTWYLQVENGPEDLKVWMDRLKRIVQCLKIEQEQQQSFGSQGSVITPGKLDKVQLDSDNPPTPSSPTIIQSQQVPYQRVKKPSVSSTSSSEYSISNEKSIHNHYHNRKNSTNGSMKSRYSTYSYHSIASPPPPQQPPPSIPPPPLPQNDLTSYYYYPEHQISVEHMTTSAVATASAAIVSPMAENITRRPSRLPNILPPQLPPPTCTLPPPPLPTTSTSMR